MRTVRSELFGGEEPPFDDVETAAEWLRQQSEIGQNDAFVAAQERLRACFEKVYAIVKAEYQGFPPGYRMNVGIERDLIAVPGWSEGQDYVPATTLQLARLATEARYIETFLGCRKVDAIGALLLDQKPPRTLGRHRYTLESHNPIGRAAPRREIEVAPDTKLNWDNFRGFARSFPESGLIGLSPKDRAFLELVDDLQCEGMVPPGPGRRGVNSGVGRYWQRFIERWNSAEDPVTRQSPYARWHAAREHYQRILQRSGTGV